MNVFQQLRALFGGGKGIEKRSATSNLANPAQWLVDILGGQSETGIPVNDKSALTLIAYFACCRIRSESIASLPLELYYRDNDGSIHLANDRPEHRLLNVAPSELYTSYNWRSAGELHLSLRGNFYSRIFRDSKGVATELVLLHPDYVRPFFHKGKLFYQLSPNPAMGFDRSETVAASDILHIKGLGQSGILGMSPIEVMRETIGMGLATRQYASRLLKNNGVMRGLLKHPGKLGEGQVKGLRDNFKGPIQRGEFPVLENGVEFMPISLKPADAEFIATSKLTRTDIASAMRVPLHMINDLDRSTNNNIEQQSLEFVQYTVRPEVKNWEQELNRSIIPIPLQGKYFYRFNIDALMRADSRARAEFYQRMFMIGVYNSNEIRELQNMNPREGGDVYYTPVNMWPSDQEWPGAGNQQSDQSNQQTQTN